MNRLTLALAPLFAALLAFSAPAKALTFQGVTFEMLALGPNTLQLDITGAVSGGTGNWANINYLNAFEVKDIGNVTGASLTGWGTNVNNGLSANAGCTTGGTPGACFFSAPPLLLTDDMSFVMTFAGTDLDFSAPHLKVQFLTSIGDAKATGDLLSRTIVTAIPEPEIYAMLVAGLGLLGFAARRARKRR
jgi:hypothetical protein